MLNQEKCMEIKILHKQGLSMREIVKQLGLSRNTVKYHLDGNRSPSFSRKGKKPLKLDPYKSYIIARVQSVHPVRIPVPVIFREICQQGYEGKIRTLNYFVSRLSQEQIQEEKVVRFETLHGQQMQIDWTILQGGKDRLLAFAGILGYSRSAYVEFTISENSENL